MINKQKNKLQNRPSIPRTVQHRTLSDMTAKLAEAGYDPSNLEERARVLAKARGLTTKRTAGEMEVDSGDEDGEGAWGDEDEMEVEEGDGSARKKQKTSTSIVPQGKRTPGTDRQVAGLGSAEVCRPPPFSRRVARSFSFARRVERLLTLILVLTFCRKPPRPSGCVSCTSVARICWPRPEKRIATSAPRCPR